MMTLDDFYTLKRELATIDRQAGEAKGALHELLKQLGSKTGKANVKASRKEIARWKAELEVIRKRYRKMKKEIDQEIATNPVLAERMKRIKK